MEIAGIRGPMSLPPEKGPGEEKKTKETRERTAILPGGWDSVQLSGHSTLEGARAAGEAVGGAEGRMEAVRARLESGELDRPEVFRETADKILKSGLSAPYGG